MIVPTTFYRSLSPLFAQETIPPCYVRYCAPRLPFPLSLQPPSLRCASRDYYAPTLRDNITGLRCVVWPLEAPDEDN